MAQIAPIVISDNAATSVKHTLVPVSQKGTYVKWRDTLPGLTTLGQIVVEMDSKIINKNLEQVEIVFSCPMLEAPAASGSSEGYVAGPKVAFDDRVRLTFFQPTRSDNVKRDRMNFLLAALLKDGQILDAVVAGNRPF